MYFYSTMKCTPAEERVDKERGSVRLRGGSTDENDDRAVSGEKMIDITELNVSR